MLMSDTLTGLQIDQISRNRIVSETDMNFFVEAGAGSGKTTMLVNRMVAMVEQGKDIEKICAITFTKAAAGEFYERFHKLLTQRSNPEYKYEDKGYAGQLPEPTEETRQRCLKALQNIDLCFMGTIDSFCNMILSEHPSEAKIPSDATIASKDTVRALCKQEYVNICKGKYGEEIEKNAALFKLFHSDAEEVFVKGMEILMSNRNVHMNYTKRDTFDADTEFAYERNSIINLLNVVNANLHKFGNAITYQHPTVTAKQALYLATRVLTKSWNDNLQMVRYRLSTLCAMGFPDDIFNHGVQKDSLWRKYMGNRLTINKTGGFFDRLNNIKYDISMTFLEKSMPYVEKAMRDKGYMTFFDYLYYLRNTLAEDSAKDGKLIKYIYDRHSYFLIDEFQDTNPMQAEIFFYLTSDTPVAKWQDSVPRPGSLFIVGDPKQSIYRFRSADVASYLKVKKLFEKMDGGDILYLSRNFRSRKVLCEGFNKAFNSLLVPSPSQCSYTDIPIVEDNNPNEFEGIFKYKAYIGKSAALYPNQTDAVQIGKIIQTIVNNDSYKITTAGDKAPRTINYNDIMIIVYGKKRLPEIMNHLDGLDIPVRVEGKVMFESNSALREVHKLYKAVAESNDRMALYDALTGRILALQDEDILKYLKEGNKLATYNIPEDQYADEAANQVRDALKLMSNLQKRARKLSPASIFSMILESFGVYQYVETDGMEVLCYAIELLRNAEKSGVIISSKDCYEFMDKLLNGEADEERCLSLDDDRNCVHMANLHKVKGLEAPVVILAYAWPTDITAESRIEYLDDSTEGYLFSVDSDEAADYTKINYFYTGAYRDKVDAEKKVLEDERARLVYVAATRARNALIISDSLYLYQGEVHKSMWEPLLPLASDFFAQNPYQAPITSRTKRMQYATDLYEKAASESALADRRSETITYQVETPSHTKIKSKLEDESVDSEVVIRDGVIAIESEFIRKHGEQPVSKAHQCPMLLGTMVHRLMEITVATRNSANVDEVIDDIINEYITPGTAQYETELRAALRSVSDQIKKGGYAQKNGVDSDVLATLLNADQVHTEVPFCYKDVHEGKDIVWNGVMDVVYLKDGKWYIIDYKTNADDEGLDDEYKNQMNIYAKAFKVITGQDAQARIYHIAV